MKAMFLKKQAGYEELVFGDLPQPRPGRGEVLVQVHATAITPAEFQWFPTFNTQDGTPRPFPIVQSHEFSGSIAGVGEGVTELKSGQTVYGMNDWFTNGAQAEFCVASAAAVAPKPRTLDHPQSAVVPISALTAWQGLFDRAKLIAGERVLVHGGAGGVGVFAVQLAHWRGAHVTATASARNLDFVRELGADEVIDYRATRFEAVARDLDVVFDVLGGETLARSWAVLRPGGRMVTIVSPNEGTTDPRTKEAFFIVEPRQSQLAEIAQLLDAGKIRSFVEAVFPLAQTREAYARAVHGGMRGKVAIQIG